ncbi:MAG: glycogen debranching enzyme family protein [Sedimentisphaerales bacterium]|nr:glycogen debranching enzyme family protein [Sedimentisphaerales bacterium]
MLTLQKADEATNISVSIADRDIDNLLTKEWLLTNGRGSYASSTIAGCNTRAYHGLLIGSLTPPAHRVMALSNCLEMVISRAGIFNLSTFEFPDKFAPTGFGFLKKFRLDIGAHFDYELENVELTKSVYLVRDTDKVAVVYDFTNVAEPVEFVSRPFVGLRNFHALQKSYATFYSKWLGSNTEGLLVRHQVPGSYELRLCCPSTKFEKDPQWWFNFTYRHDRERGQDFTEDLWTPGFFKCRIDSPVKIVLWVSLSSPKAGKKHDPVTNMDIDTVCKDLQKYRREQMHLITKAKDKFQIPVSNGRSKNQNLRIGNWKYYEMLCLAAEQFITKRRTNNKTTTTILAGYPWFADWGRDAFISLPGLLLATGRFEQAKSVLTTFAGVADEGMIPNRFDDYSDSTHFNSVDASLWFINAAFQYLQASDDSKTFIQALMPTIRWIVDSYQKGTKFGIHADTDGLITAGDEQTQLTWMDAKCDGIAFTPRYGKAVEVNALWYNSLCLLAEFYAGRDEENSKHYDSMAEKVRSSFRELFWNDSKDYLNDCILPDGSIDDSLRPNQIFAVSLKFSPLSQHQQASVVEVVQNHLLTPYGLRTLSSDSPGYKGVYTGPIRQRDEAYHQGTVWPYLIGPFIEAYLKVNEFSPESKSRAAEFIEPLLEHLTEDGCLGSISEIFDGDEPHKPKGCFAQAWSVAELIRAYQLINGPSAGP